MNSPTRAGKPGAQSILGILLPAMRTAILLVLAIGLFEGLRATLKAENFLPDSGRARIIVLQERWRGLLQPLSAHNTHSTLTIYEDGRPLGPQTGFHHEIRERGKGLYSHWGVNVWFSASDNTDPEANGREYVVSYPLRLHPLALAFLVAAYVLLYLAGRQEGPGGFPEKKIIRRLSELWTSAPLSGQTGYWLLLGFTFAAGLAYRLYWTLYLEVPCWLPDGRYYLGPVLTNPLLPLSQEQLPATSWTVALGFIHLGHPVWFLAVQNLLWAGSTLLLTLALALKQRLRPAALAICFYLCFVEKNLQFEYALLSEHLSRTLICLFFSVLILKWGRPTKTNAAVLGLIATAAILTKPSAVVLGASFGVFLLAAPAMDRKTGLRQIAAPALIFTVLTASLLGGYGLLYQHRFGVFSLASSGGYKLFFHAGHLIDLESEKHREIKRELKKFMPLYLRKYATRRNHQGGWLNRGFFTPELRQDFGDRSPYGVVRDYVAKRYPEEKFHQEINRIFMELALEGIGKNPWKYLRHVSASLRDALEKGWAGEYPHVRFARHDLRATDFQARNLSVLQIWFEAYLRNPPQRLNLLGSLREGGPPFWGKVAELAGQVPGLLTRIMDRWGGAFRLVLALSLISLPFQLIHLRSRPRLFSLALLMSSLAAALAGYLAFIGLLIVTDPSRLMVNVQDLAVLWFLLQINLVWSLFRPNENHQRTGSGTSSGITRPPSSPG